ncbi:MAG: hypothetical protein AB1611_22420 [bacterium]
MNTLEKVLDFEKEADDIIQKAQKRGQELLISQEEERKKIEKDWENKLAQEKKALQAQWNRRLSSLSTEEAQKKEAVLKNMKANSSHHIDKAIEMVLSHI